MKIIRLSISKDDLEKQFEDIVTATCIFEFIGISISYGPRAGCFAVFAPKGF